MVLRSALPVEEVARLLDVRGRQARQVGLWGRCDGGRVTVRVPARGDSDLPPVLRAELAPDGAGSVLRGAVRESLAVPVVQWTMVLPGVVLLLVLVALLTEPSVDAAGVAVCGVGGSALVLVGLLLRRQRARTFAADVEELRTAVVGRLGR